MKYTIGLILSFLILINVFVVSSETQIIKENETENTTTSTSGGGGTGGGSGSLPIRISKKPVVDYFVMSFCPFSNQVENEIIRSLYNELKNYVSFKPHYVIYENLETGLCISNKGRTYCAMRGIEELNQNIREICVKNIYGLKKYYRFVTKVNKECSLNDIETCWKEMAKKSGVSTSKVKNCRKTKQFSILSKELKDTKKFHVDGSPTIFINNKQYSGPRTKEELKSAICNSIKGKKPKACSYSETIKEESKEIAEQNL